MLSAIAAAVVFAVITDSPAPLIGAFPPVYGLIGAFTYMLWVHLGRTGERQLQAFRLIGLLMALQLLFGVLFGGDITWIADIAGFVAGFALCAAFVPGGWQRLIGYMRRD